ncbi:MAG: MATE family efflux transporter [Lachnospiraceae bacterium]|nr:MATE family efflux transporter [Lachnospiraceae bacterium]
MENVKENKMGVMPINKLIINMSLPMMASMLVQALYNIVDSIYVSQIHQDALTALNLCFPIQMLVMAFGNGMAIGVNALVSRALGEKNKERADRVAMNGVFLAVLSAFVFLLFGLFLVKPYFTIQNTDTQQIKDFGVQYLTINCCLSIALYSQIIFERLLQSTGKTFYSMITQGVGAITNIILDPILIFGLLGMPKLGVRGAAIATVFGQLLAATLGIIFNIVKNKEITLKLKNLMPDIRIIGNIYSIGLPSIIMMAIGSVMNAALNHILLGFSDTADTVFGAYYKIQSFFFMPVFGLNGSVVPIIGYNFGAGKRKRLLDAVKLGVVYAEFFMVLGLLAFEIVPNVLLMIFKPSEEMLSLGVTAFRIIGIHFPIAGVCIIVGTVFQALNHGVYSTWISVARQLLALLPAAYLLSLTGNVNMVWFAFPIAEAVSLVMTLIFFSKVYKKTIVNIPNNE